ncbi:polymorphic toxin-type HINT domain-containing protein [Streptomyces sp. TRM 70361]|uniref:polymorphic toxin-type HINT domain-containing protein n=1 Tax=Streptomyces sp. TRM 70361 TaxID=3116553 RepID=UPI002E7AB257|nr:polymorphic toxin-type HINT domain-containing protein [Streptomyces sp. TRM 70361]MEE1941154.1 polymorphic toxin-type HINT domain-containing protein [Streptomyces sp. TRM 70361]
MNSGTGTSRQGRGKERRRGARLLAQSLILAVVVSGGITPVARAENGKLPALPEPPEPRVAKVREITGQGAAEARERVAKTQAANAEQARRAKAEQRAAWPEPGEAEVKLAAGKTAKASPGDLPVTLSPQTEVPDAAAGETRVAVLGQKAAREAGVTGVLLTAEADTAGRAAVRVDYGDFAGVVGGGWSQRLRLVRLPACALTTPQKTECRKQTPLASSNDITGQTVSAQVPLAGTESGLSTQTADDTSAATVLALTATSAGTGQSPTGTGDYSATELSESSSWQAGGSSGSFTWSYDFILPPAAAGPSPELSLSYDSGSVDGRTATTNNQGTPVGEGFSLTESYIERSYGSCDDDGHKDVFDRCWKYDNARLVLNGKATRLVKVDSDTWRLQNDDDSKVTRSTGADNGDDNGEYWTVVTGDGTRYVFGRDKLDGAGDQRTNSTWTVPVFGDDSGEPGYSRDDSFAGRSLTQAWRWNLDHVEDTHGNATTYWYAKETNHYRKNKADKANASYTRGGYLKEIKYGLRKGALFTDDADAKVTFTHAERCTATDCSKLTEDTADNWPDVPYDAICSDGDDDCDSAGPAFFTRKRLTGVHTWSWSAASSAHEPVDSWTLAQQYLDGGDIGDTSDHVLTLKSIKRTGKAATDHIAVNPVAFTYQMRPNRVDGTDDILPLTRPRISTITSETGAITDVTLSGEECRRSEVMKAAEDTNTRSCYPQYWHVNGAREASVDWFHKYRVLAVVNADPTGKNGSVEHEYVYSGAAWHYSDDPLTPKSERTWSDWRGYRQVTAYTGAKDVTRSKTVSHYMQGMDGDRRKDGSTRSVDVTPPASPDIGVAAITDSDQYAGQLRQEVVYDGATAISATVNDPWSKETARQDAPDAGDHIARYVRTKKSTDYTYLTASRTWRARAVATTYDDHGMPATVDDSGEVGRSGDETCTRTWYARNTAAGLTSLVSRTRTVGRSCSVTDAQLNLPTTPATRGDALSDVATVYDNPQATGWTAAQKPTKGAATWNGRATGYAVATTADGDRLPTGWQTVTTTTHDALGRLLSVTNADGKAVTTAYTPATAGPLTKTRTADPKGHKATEFLDPRRGMVQRSYDPNGGETQLAHDALGRLTEVWLPNRVRGEDLPNTKLAYHLSDTRPSWVSTSTVRKDGKTYNTAYTLYDALLRPLQTQSPTPRGGRLLTDTRYDTRGLAHETYADIFDNASTPNGTYTRAEHGEAPKQVQTVFDGAERAVSSSLLVLGVKKWSTTTSYTGDSTATTALDGGSAQRTITDVRDRTVETREYAGESPADASYGTGPGTPYTAVKTTYTLDDQQRTVTGPDGAKWTYGYDLFGRQVSADDPDKGETTTAYDILDRAVKSTDARGRTILTAYDELDRVTGTWAGEKTDAAQLTARTYDTVLKGQPATSTRYVGGKGGQAYTKAVTAYDSLNRPVGTALRLPADDPFVQAGTPAELTYVSDYNIDGTLGLVREPALGGLPSENITYGHNALGQVTSVSGSTGYLLNTDYSALGQAQQLVLGTSSESGTAKAFVSNTYEEGTGRLTRSRVTDLDGVLQDLTYRFDDAGNVTSIADPTTLGGIGKAETQCFDYDGHRRLTEAWTPASQNCSDSRSAGRLSGPAPYWNSYTYNDAGQRTSETVHKTDGADTTTYCYTGDKPHTLTGTSTDADCANPDRTYAYDPSGNTTRRPGESGPQELDWSEEGHLTELTESDTSTGYLYDADGTLLIRTTEDGERVLYAGATELHLRADGTAWAQRYYSAGDLTVALRTNASGTNTLRYLAGDHHGTSTLAISSDTQKVTKRYTTPFGAERGTPVAGPWPDDKQFLGKTHDTTTGLTHIGVRQYDSGTGQFISVDPLLNPRQHQSVNGYSYAGNNPVTFADPTGKAYPECASGQYDCTNGSGGTGDIKKIKRGKNYHKETAAQGGTGGGRQYGNRGGGGGTHRSSNKVVKIQVAPPSCAWRANTCSQPPTGEPDWKFFWDTGTALLLPDVDAWDRCFTEADLAGCGWAATDLPWLKVVKGGKILAKPLKGCKCFLAGTDVLMADGTTKDIEDVELGDKVLATDPETGETGPREVTRLIVTEDDKHFNKLSIATGDGVETLTATHEHPFWSPSEKRWVEAEDLRPGMTLLTDENETVIVTANRPFTKRATTYNLTVDDLHTYYALAGETPVLVHNSNCDAPSGSLQGQKLADRLRKESAGSPFTPGGFLEPEAIENSRLIMPGSDMNNKALRARLEERGGVSQWGKYSTETHQSSYGDYQVHYYMNSTTGEVMYGFDYKVVMNRR